MGNAFWKLYVNTNDIATMHQAAVDAGHRSIMAPLRLDQWPMSIGFVADPDGYQVELAQRHPWTDGDDTTAAWLGQYCINVTDLDRSVGLYEALGLDVHEPHRDPRRLRGDPREPREGLEGPARAAEGPGRPHRHGHRHVEALREHRRHRGASTTRRSAPASRSLQAPERYDRWPVSVGFVADPDGYQVELVQRHPW